MLCQVNYFGEDAVCALCNQKSCKRGDVSELGNTAADTINFIKLQQGSDSVVSSGQFVHKACRKNLSRHVDINDEEQPSTSQRRIILRSAGNVFNCREQCLSCGKGDRYNKKKPAHVLRVLESEDFEANVRSYAAKRCDDDEWKFAVLERLAYVVNDQSFLAQPKWMFHKTCKINFSKPERGIPTTFAVSKPLGRKGRPIDDELKEAFDKVMLLFEKNEDGDLTIHDLVKKMSECLLEMDSEMEAYSNRYMKSKMIEKYGHELVISHSEGRSDIVNLRVTLEHIMNKFDHETKDSQTKLDVHTERNTIIETAASIIKSEIKEVVQDKTFFPSSDELCEEEALEFLPSSLQQLLKLIFHGEDNNIKIGFIGQAIMQACRPRGILCPLQLGLAVQFHNFFQSRLVVDELHEAGFCSSYWTVEKFENCAALHQDSRLSQLELNGNEHTYSVQYMADNIDHNIANLDGRNTLHAMGMMATITPATKLISKIPVSSNISKDEIIALANIDIPQYMFEDILSPNIILQPLTPPNPIGDISTDIDLLWKLSQKCGFEYPGWFGFMQMIENGRYPGKSSIHYLPIINLDPTNMTCIYSTLTFISKHASQYNITPVVTFDQPLYWKALTIMQKCEIAKLVLRLGSFHTLMSFLGTVGTIMEGTGIEKILQLIYGENSVTHIMSGKAVSRALRAHTILDSSLYALILDHTFPCNNDEDEVSLTNPFITDIKTKLQEILSSGKADSTELPFLNNFKVILESFRSETSSRRTSVLWFQYLETIDIILCFLRAERTGNWEMHLNTIKLMLPYLAATGHNNYVKSIYVYVQQMQELSVTHPDVYSMFISGHHSIWRSNRYWGGLSTDLIIEQCLMRHLKSRGGLTRGRGVTDAQRATWVMSAPIVSEINSAMQDLTKQCYVTSEQHKEAYSSRSNRDYEDRLIIYNFLKDRSPFNLPCHLRNVVTGVSCSVNVNVEESKKVGEMIIKDKEGCKTDNLHFKRSWQVKTFKSAFKTDTNGIQRLNPTQLFQRCITISAKLSLDYKEVLKYELTPYPVPLFQSPHTMHDANKPAFADALWSLLPVRQPVKPNNPKYIIDGGGLLYRVNWYLGQTFDDIMQRYASYLLSKYRGNDMPTIIFDGYTNSTPKDSTHLRRTGGSVGPTIMLNPSLMLTMNRKLFLSCNENKMQFIHMLGEYLEKKGFTVLYAQGDADYLTARTAFDSAMQENTILIGDDTDLLIILLHLNYGQKAEYNLFFCPEPKSNSKKAPKVWNIHFACDNLPQGICENILLLHALHGCDTTSRLPNVRINVLWKLINDPEFLLRAAQFRNPSSQKMEIVESGTKILVLVYGGKISQSLHEIRAELFIKKTKLHLEFNGIENYPPTFASAALHVQRIFLQVMAWKGINLDPLKWGFAMKDDFMLPIMSDEIVCAKVILDKIKCGCKTGCKRTCSCRVFGIECNDNCTKCVDNCTNKVFYEDDGEAVD